MKDFAPFCIGKVVDPEVYDRKTRYALVRSARARELAIIVEPHALRYWVRKPVSK